MCGLFGDTVNCYEEGVEGGLGVMLVCVCAATGPLKDQNHQITKLRNIGE